MFFYGLNTEIFEKTSCYNCTAILMAVQENKEIAVLGLSDEVLEQACSRLESLGMLPAVLVDSKSALSDKKAKKKAELEQLFEQFWVSYGRVGVKSKAKTQFLKLSVKDRELLNQNLPKYLQSTTNGDQIKYRKYAEAYLRNRMFDPENYKINETPAQKPAYTNPKVQNIQSKTVTFGQNESENRLLALLQANGFAVLPTGQTARSEQEIKEYFIKEKEYAQTLRSQVKAQLGCDLNDQRIMIGGAFHNLFINIKNNLQQQFFGQFNSSPAQPQG